MSTGKILKSFLLIILMGCASLVFGQQQSPDTPASASFYAEPLTLERAVDLALKRNRSVKNAELEVYSFEDQLKALKTKRLPSFKVTALVNQPLTSFEQTFEKGIFGTFPGTGPIPSEDTTISSSKNPTAVVNAQVTQPLSQLFRINLNIRQLELSREMGAEELRLKQQSVVNDVKRAYYSILQTQSAFESTEASVKLYREVDRVTETYVLQQVALKTDQLEVQSKLAKAEYELLTLNNLLASQKEQLNHLLGRDVNTEFVVTDGFDAAQYVMRETDLATARERALEQRPEIRKARLGLGQARLDRRIKKSEYIPEVSLNFNYTSPIGYSGILPRSISGVAVQVEWEVFDWGRRKNELAEKGRVIEQAENSLREAESQVLMDVNNHFRKLQENCQLLRVTRMSQEAAVANLKVVTYKYRVQSVLLKDVLQAQAALADANYEYRKALMSFWTAKADFEKALGEDR
jgi:outer membrane protein TolC